MKRLERFAYAIQSHEGYFVMSRSWRNNNPGNLRSSIFAVDYPNNYARFASYATGWAALLLDLYGKCRGNTATGLRPSSTLAEFCRVWAPSADGNDTEAYIVALESSLSLPRSTTLSYFTGDF